jgi:hypothetical protein
LNSVSPLGRIRDQQQAPVKCERVGSDQGRMAKDTQCQSCDADVLLEGDEEDGEVVFCGYCSAPYRVKRVGDDESDIEVEEDF